PVLISHCRFNVVVCVIAIVCTLFLGSSDRPLARTPALPIHRQIAPPPPATRPLRRRVMLWYEKVLQEGARYEINRRPNHPPRPFTRPRPPDPPRSSTPDPPAPAPRAAKP